MGFCYKCGAQLDPNTRFCQNCGAEQNQNQNQNQFQNQNPNPQYSYQQNNYQANSNATDHNLVRFLLTFFLGFIGSIVINYSSFKPNGWKSRTLAYIFLTFLTFGIYHLVASISNLMFDPTKNSNIGYFRD